MTESETEKIAARPRAALLAALLLLALLPFIVFGLAQKNSFAPSLTSDYWEHATAIRAFAENLKQPQFPMRTGLNLRGLSPYHFTLALAAKFFQMNAFEALQLAGGLNILLFLLSLFYFLRVFGRPTASRYFFLLFSVYSLWGFGAGFSGEYHLIFLPYNPCYPSFFAFAVSLLALKFWAFFLQNSKLNDLVAFFVASAMILSIHQLTLLYFLAPSCLVFSWYFGGERFIKNCLLLFGIWAGGVCLFLLWPYISVVELIELAYKRITMADVAVSAEGDAQVLRYLKTSPFAHYPLESYYSKQVLVNFGPSFLALACLPLLRDSRKRLLFILLLAVPAFFWALSAFVPWPPAAWRFSAFLIFWLQVLLAHELWTSFAAVGNKSASTARKAFFYLFLATCFVLLVIHFRVSAVLYGTQTESSFASLSADFDEIKKHVSNDSLIVGKRDFDWVLTSYGLKTAMHFPIGKWARASTTNVDVNVFDDSQASPEERCKAMERLGATHFVYRKTETSPPKATEMQFPPGSTDTLYEGTLIKLVLLKGCSDISAAAVD